MGESRTSTALPNATSESRAEAMHNTLAEREEALRRVAVVLSRLPASTASTLLDKGDGYSRHIVTQAITTLHTVPAKERRDILDSFKLGMSGKSQSEPRKEHSAGSPSAASLQQVAEGIHGTRRRPIRRIDGGVFSQQGDWRSSARGGLRDAF
jgi:hypothetical protein